MSNHLPTFFKLVYKHINPENDIDRSGSGAFSPTNRDHAQEFRNYLFGRIVENQNPIFDELLEELLSDPFYSEIHESVEFHIAKRAEKICRQHVLGARRYPFSFRKLH